MSEAIILDMDKFMSVVVAVERLDPALGDELQTLAVPVTTRTLRALLKERTSYRSAELEAAFLPFISYTQASGGQMS